MQEGKSHVLRQGGRTTRSGFITGAGACPPTIGKSSPRAQSASPRAFDLSCKRLPSHSSLLTQARTFFCPMAINADKPHLRAAHPSSQTHRVEDLIEFVSVPAEMRSRFLE